MSRDGAAASSSPATTTDASASSTPSGHAPTHALAPPRRFVLHELTPAEAAAEWAEHRSFTLEVGGPGCVHEPSCPTKPDRSADDAARWYSTRPWDSRPNHTKARAVGWFHDGSRRSRESAKLTTDHQVGGSNPSERAQQDLTPGRCWAGSLTLTATRSRRLQLVQRSYSI